MIHIDILKKDLEKGFSKSSLERLIGLPKNCLSGVINSGKKLSKISELKIEKWEASEKPDPLNLKVPKTEPEKLTKLFVSANQNIDKFGSETQATNLSKPKVKTQVEFPKDIPPIPVREEKENAIDFAARKNEWKRNYGS